ncbi:MAG: hypothetical protein OJF49_002666 [Ktedonobacterales bacterium]|nr:MAG: hypothetical protein OJF49_002666 [Ktedonobacterales bacterium]
MAYSVLSPREATKCDMHEGLSHAHFKNDEYSGHHISDAETSTFKQREEAPLLVPLLTGCATVCVFAVR